MLYNGNSAVLDPEVRSEGLILPGCISASESYGETTISMLSGWFKENSRNASKPSEHQ